MSSTTDKVTGLTNQTVGKIKQGAGKAMGSNKLQIEGKAQEARGAVLGSHQRRREQGCQFR